MLDHEYGLLIERLDGQRGARTKFFVFANTVATRSYSRKQDGHGWLGIRFQNEPQHPPSDITMHVRLTDDEAEQQQEALGLVGVNLVYGALHAHQDPSGLIRSLLDNLTTARVEIDMVDFSGPAFAGLDNRLMSLELVQAGLTHAAMFTADGRVVQPSDVLYKKCILIERGSFRPATRVTVDMLASAQAQFVQEQGANGCDLEVLFEMTLNNLREGQSGSIDHQDFLERADALATLGKTVLISNYGEYHRLAAYLHQHTRQLIGIVMGVPTLRELFNEKYYADLDGGILESFGRLFKNDLKVYVYPQQDANSGSLVSAGNLRVDPHLRHLYAYLVENQLIEGIRGFDPTCLPIYSRDVLARLRRGDASWETMTPPAVAELVKRRRLFGYVEPGQEADVASQVGSGSAA